MLYMLYKYRRAQTCWHQEFNGVRVSNDIHLIYQAGVSWYIHLLLLFQKNISAIYDCQVRPYTVYRTNVGKLQLPLNFILNSQRVGEVRVRSITLPTEYPFTWGEGNNPFGALASLGFDAPPPQTVNPYAAQTRSATFYQLLQSAGQCAEVGEDEATRLLMSKKQFTVLKRHAQLSTKAAETSTQEGFDELYLGIYKFYKEWRPSFEVDAQAFWDRNRGEMLKYFLKTEQYYKRYSGCIDDVSDDIESIANETSISLKETIVYSWQTLVSDGVKLNHLQIDGQYPVPSV